MKITKSKLKQIIKEELQNALKENFPNPQFRAAAQRGDERKQLAKDLDSASKKAITPAGELGQFTGKSRFNFEPVGETPEKDLAFAISREDNSVDPIKAAKWWFANFPNQSKNEPIAVSYIIETFKADGNLETVFSEPLNDRDAYIKNKIASWA
tara:strand:- start:86 stop:547 length:462 start_codon:yes stop_codon:yes gene_type:complete